MTRIILDEYDYMALPHEDDPNGEEALWQGGCRYDRAMSITEPAKREDRIREFQAAEQLYLQAAARGNEYASLCLGYIYSYDRCAGRYWREGGGNPGEPYPREARAFECFAAAALEVAVDAGEAWYEKALASARAGIKRCEQETA
ncbi:MAG: hypothetical protein IJG88_00480 [Eggerthellaceae bacterium]|nr:hypothetical protein [Eggerthellaceae bacterium]